MDFAIIIGILGSYVFSGDPDQPMSLRTLVRLADCLDSVYR